METKVEDQMAQQNQKTTKKSQEDKVVKDKKQDALVEDDGIKMPKNIDEHTITAIGQKVKVLNDISTIDGTLYKDEIVKVEAAIHFGNSNLKVIDNLGRYWFVNSKDITTKIK